jgi:hypothetical protein
MNDNSHAVDVICIIQRRISMIPEGWFSPDPNVLRVLQDSSDEADDV